MGLCPSCTGSYPITAFLTPVGSDHPTGLSAELEADLEDPCGNVPLRHSPFLPYAPSHLASPHSHPRISLVLSKSILFTFQPAAPVTTKARFVQQHYENSHQR